MQINRIVILGGGSAGWLTAGRLAADHADRGVEITVVESPDVRTVGVGEGTWPSMRDTLARIGLSETAFLRECDGAFKQGSLFCRWKQDTDEDRYYHPFSAPAGWGETDLTSVWDLDTTYADLVSPQPALCDAGCGPKQTATPEYAGVANYGYHLNAGKFGEVLKRHCCDKLGVRYISAHVDAINACENGDIRELVLRDGNTVPGDLFIDCSGFAAVLIGEHYGVAFEDLDGVLFNDRALAIQAPHATPDAPLACATRATAHESGWTWDIGLPTRRGIGLVYSSRFTDDDQAYGALAGYLGSSDHLGKIDAQDARKLSFRPGHRKLFWHRNCLAIGISAGFIEPLEASALALIEMSVDMLSRTLPPTRELMDVAARRFNERFQYRWSRISEFLKLHYVLSERSGSYWDHHRDPDTWPQALRENLALWKHRPPSREDFWQIEEIFPAASYQYVLAGMGFRQEAPPKPAGQERQLVTRTAEMTRRMLGGLPAHRELLASIVAGGLPPAEVHAA